MGLTISSLSPYIRVCRIHMTPAPSIVYRRLYRVSTFIPLFAPARPLPLCHSRQLSHRRILSTPFTGVASRRIHPNPCFTMSMSTDNLDFDLDELVENFKKNVSIKDRRYRLTTYKNCFVGSDAVQWMVTSGAAENREDAVKLGLLLQEKGIIEHCLRDHE